MPYRDRIHAPWPEKLLALDGSGVVTLELQGLQSMLGDRLGGAP